MVTHTAGELKNYWLLLDCFFFNLRLDFGQKHSEMLNLCKLNELQLRLCSPPHTQQLFASQFWSIGFCVESLIACSPLKLFFIRFAFSLFNLKQVETLKVFCFSWFVKVSYLGSQKIMNLNNFLYLF